MRKHKNMSMNRLNLNEAVIPVSFGERIVGINEEMGKVIEDLLREVSE